MWIYPQTVRLRISCSTVSAASVGVLNAGMALVMGRTGMPIGMIPNAKCARST